jgi:hypothetical protein
MKSAKEIILEWTLEYPRFYFFLPDGPYGRPLDNQYTLKSISETTGQQLIASLSDSITFRFSGPTTVQRDDRQLCIEGFSTLIFSDAVGSKSYSAGEVCFVGG